MKTIELLIEDDFYEEFLQTLPKDKVTVCDEVFIDSQKNFRKELDSFYKDEADFTSYFDTMKEVDAWIKKEYQS